MKPLIKKPSMLTRNTEGVLSRNEMKNIMAGNSTVQSSCDYDGCEGASETFICWYGECSNNFSGDEAIDCMNDTGESQQLAIAMCGPNYS